MMYCMVENEFKIYPWCRRSLDGLYSEARKKRVIVREIGNFGEIPKNDETPAVILIGASGAWLKKCVTEANRQNVYPIALTNQQQDLLDSPCSYVVMDIQDSMQLAVGYLRSLGKTRLALYGVNPYSTSDPWRAEVFCRITGGDAHIYYNNGSLKDTFDLFRLDIDQYDGVICTCDYAAVSLIRRLRTSRYEKLGSLYILSYGDMFLSRKFSPSITSISDNYESFGKAAMSIYDLITREKAISAVNILLHSRMHIRETTGNMPYEPSRQNNGVSAPPIQNLFFQEQEIAEMAKVEMMLCRCDETDFALLQCLMQSDTYAAMSEKCYISETVVKYRTKKIEKLCDVSSRTELKTLLEKYF